MRNHVVRAAALLILAAAVLAPRVVAGQDLSAAPRITVAELKKLRTEGRVVVVDVRDAESYKAGHIPGALSIPLDQVSAHVDELKAAGKPIVTYCA